MASSFDPYLNWLGIPLSQRPITYYGLLGIKLFENNPEAIAKAAEKRTSQLGSVVRATNSPDYQRILKEITAARDCLLDPELKPRYDQKLRQRAAKTTSSHGAALQLPKPGQQQVAASEMPRPAIAAPVAPPEHATFISERSPQAPATVEVVDDLPEVILVNDEPNSVRTANSQHRVWKDLAKPWRMIAIATAAIVLLCGLIFVVVAFLRESDEPVATKTPGQSNVSPEKSALASSNVATPEKRPLGKVEKSPDKPDPPKTLSRAEVMAAKWRLAQIDDPANVPPRLTAILGDPRFGYPERVWPSLYVTQDRKLLVRGRTSLRVWSLPEGQLIHEYLFDDFNVSRTYSTGGNALDLNKDESIAAMVESDVVYRFNLRTGKPLPPITTSPRREEKRTRRSLSNGRSSDDYVFTPDLSACAFKTSAGITVGKLENDQFVPMVSNRADWWPCAMPDEGRFISGFYPEELTTIDVASPPPPGPARQHVSKVHDSTHHIPPYIATVDDNLLKLIDVASRQVRWQTNAKGLERLVASPDGRYLAMLFQDREPYSLRIYDVNQHRQVFHRPFVEVWGGAWPKHGENPRLRFSNDASLLTIWFGDASMRVIEVPSGKTFAAYDGCQWSQLTFNIEETALAAIDARGRAAVWSVPGGELRCRIDADQKVSRPRLSPDGKQLWVYSNAILSYDAHTGKYVRKIYDANLSDDEYRYTIGSDNRSLMLFGKRIEAGSTEHLARVKGFHSADGGIFFKCETHGSKTEVVDTATGEFLLDVRQHRGPCAASRNGKFMVAQRYVQDKPSLGVWDLASRKELQAFEGVDILGGFLQRSDLLTINDQGLIHALSASSPQVLRLNGATGKQLASVPLFSERLKMDSEVWKARFAGCALSPRGSYVALSQRDGTILLFDVRMPDEK